MELRMGWFKRKRTAVAPPTRNQSVDELIANMNQTWAGTGGTVNRELSGEEAMRHYYGWQYAAAVALAESVMMTPWEVETYDGETWVAEPTHHMADVFGFANPYMTGEEMQYWMIVETVFRGKTVWQIVFDANGMPSELWPMVGAVTHKTAVVAGPDGKRRVELTGWKQEYRDKHGKTISQTYEPAEVLYHRIPRPGTMFGGYGSAQAAGSMIKLWEQIIDSEWAAFKQGIFPFAILMMDEPDSARRDAALEKFNDKYAGAKNTGKAIGLNRGKVDIQWPQTKPREMGYRQSEESTRDNTLGIMRTPPAILGMSKDYNRANIEGIEAIWGKWRVAPTVRMLDARLNQDLIQPYFADPPTRIRHYPSIPADREADLKQDQLDLMWGAMTPGDLAKKRGLPADFEGADTRYQPSGAVPIGTVPAAPEPEEEEEEEEEQSIHGMPLGETYTQRGERERQAVSRAFIKAKLRTQARYRAAVRAHFAWVEKATLAAWSDIKETYEQQALPEQVDNVLTPEGLAADMAERVGPSAREGIVLGGEFNRSFVGSAKEFPFNESMPGARAAVAEATSPARFAGIAGETRRQMTATVLAGIEQGETWDELRLRIVQKFGIMKESRAANIATTESTKVWNAGGQAFRDEYALEFKEWICSFVNSRETHMQADGAIVGNGEMFSVGDDSMAYPGEGGLAEENCNCNCAAVPSRGPAT